MKRELQAFLIVPPLAALITLGSAFPIYLLLQRIGRVSLGSAAITGVAIGLVYAYVAYRVGNALPLGVWQGPVIGGCSAAAWWRWARGADPGRSVEAD